MIEMGWLSPEGEMIEAGYMEHISVADKIVEHGWLIDHGWVRISRLIMFEHKYIIMWYFHGHLTQAQKDWLKPRVEQNWNLIENYCKNDLIYELDLDKNLFKGGFNESSL